jgi:GTP-binding protein Era
MASVRRSGTAALVGRPNVGKSTLLNRLIGLKVAIVSPKPQTTRSRILGVVNTPEGQIAFFDSPGIHRASGALNQYLADVAWRTIREVDAAVMIVEAGTVGASKADAEDRRILEKLTGLGKRMVLAINKVDRIAKPLLLPQIDRYRGSFDFAEIVPISARTGDGVTALQSAVLQALPEADPLFDDKMLTDQTERILAGEYIREQLLRHCREEVPHRSAVVVEHFDESERGKEADGLVRIGATIYVERQNQRAIVIGKRGQMLKNIGSDARRQIEDLLGARVYLELRVAVEPGWSDRAGSLGKLGYE